MDSHNLARAAEAWNPTATHHAPSYHHDAIFAIAAAFMAVTITFTSLRFFVRGYMIRSLGWDDWLILLALGSFICQAAFFVHITWIEQNQDLETIKPLSEALEYVVLESGFYLLATIFLKLSLAVFFLRIVGYEITHQNFLADSGNQVVNKWQRRVIIISTMVFSVYTFGFFFVAIFQCGDPAKYVMHKVQGKCIAWSALGPMNYIHGVMNALTDWIFVSLPIFVVRKAKMSDRDKWSVVFVLIIGVLGSVASVVRLFYISDLQSGDRDAPTFFSKASKIAIASTIEPGMGIAAACIATLRPMFKSILERTCTHSSSTCEKNRLSSAERGLPSRSGVTSPPQSPYRGEFANYGFASDAKSRAKSEPQVELVRLPSGRTSTAASDEVMVQFDAVQSERRESQTDLLAEVQQAKQAYSTRIWSGKGGARV